MQNVNGREPNGVDEEPPRGDPKGRRDQHQRADDLEDVRVAERRCSGSVIGHGCPAEQQQACADFRPPEQQLYDRVHDEVEAVEVVHPFGHASVPLVPEFGPDVKRAGKG